MNIAIASDDKKEICAHFGMTKGFVILNIEDGKVKNQDYRINTFTGHHNHQHGNGNGQHHHDHQNKHDAILTALSDCEVVISNGMGRKIYIDLQNAGIKPYITNVTNVDEAVNLFIHNKLDDNPNRGCQH